jgi:hypothetical protein
MLKVLMCWNVVSSAVQLSWDNEVENVRTKHELTKNAVRMTENSTASMFEVMDMLTALI